MSAEGFVLVITSAGWLYFYLMLSRSERRYRQKFYRFNIACAQAFRWLDGDAAKTAEWIAQVGNDERGCDISEFRQRLRESAPTGGE